MRSHSHCLWDGFALFIELLKTKINRLCPVYLESFNKFLIDLLLVAEIKQQLQKRSITFTKVENFVSENYHVFRNPAELLLAFIPSLNSSSVTTSPIDSIAIKSLIQQLLYFLIQTFLFSLLNLAAVWIIMSPKLIKGIRNANSNLVWLHFFADRRTGCFILSLAVYPGYYLQRNDQQHAY